MNVSPRRRLFHRQNENNIYRMFLWAILIVAGLWLVYGVNRGAIEPMGRPTPTATRVVSSYTEEGEIRFAAGDIFGAIEAYRRASEIDPNNAQILAKMARIQTYSSVLRTTDEEERIVLSDALRSINLAKALAPDDSTVAAIRAFVLDWNANPSLNPETAPDLLAEAEQEALRALQLDNTNTLALVFYAEILIDQLKMPQAQQYLDQAQARGEASMDLHRVNAYYLESWGQYSQAIEEYDRAIALAPKLTFLYLRAGANYRQLAMFSTIKAQQTQLYEQSIIYFKRARDINAQLSVLDPIPFLSLSKTYSQMGDYYRAGINIQNALEFRPGDPDIFGQLGVVFQKSRNFEGAIMAFKCAIEGCTPDESCLGRYGRACDPDFQEVGVEVKPLALSQGSIVYFYSYVSNLAALSRPQANQCPKARQVMATIVAGGFGSDPIVSQILAENENICRIVDAGGPLALRTLTPQAEETGTPEPDSTPTYASTPEPSLTPTP